MKRLLHYILLHKPFGVLSQFTPALGHRCLGDFGPFPSTVYAVGRLDADSEGLLLLTDDNAVKHRLTDPKFDHPKTYLAQVERIPNQESLEKLRAGIILDASTTKPAEVRLLENEPDLPPRAVPIRYRKNVPTGWLEITLREGKNRQVRRMTAAVGFPTLRLIRTKIGTLSLEGLEPGLSRLLTPKEIADLNNSLKL